MSALDRTTEKALAGIDHKAAISCERLVSHQRQTLFGLEPYWGAISGGKDSDCILGLLHESGVPFEAHCSLTTVDPPQLIEHLTLDLPEVSLDKPDTSMYRLIAHSTKQMPPTQTVRYCCDHLKERGGRGRQVVLGVRWQESNNRAKRRMVETCYTDPSKTYINPIIDWTTEDVWAYIHTRRLPYCRLYDEGWHRLGCILCPMSSNRIEQIHQWPRFANMYLNACHQLYARLEHDGVKMTSWHSGFDIFEWFISEKNSPLRKQGKKIRNADQGRFYSMD